MKPRTLYKRNNNGKLQVWRIWVEGSTIFTEWGENGGQLQVTSDEVKEGKNLGKANATTAAEQAVAEAESRWRKKRDRNGYVEDPDRAKAGENDAEGGIAPMLAKPLEDVVKHIKYPCDIQRKYDGVRCIAVIENGEVTLWSRKRTQYTSAMPHVVAAYKVMFAGVPGTFMFDGELYRHGWSLQKISGYARNHGPKEGCEEVSHFVYDLPSQSELPWRERWLILTKVCFKGPEVQLVTTTTIPDFESAKRLHDVYVQEGYEGGILRNLHAKYQAGKRSADLAKVKEFDDGEFEITAVNDGRGKFSGLAVFTCKTDAGAEFDCCSPGTLKDRAEFMRRGNELLGKKLTVKYFGWTDDKKPFLPVGKAVRDYE